MLGADRNVTVFVAFLALLDSLRSKESFLTLGMELATKPCPFIALNAWREDANLTKPFCINIQLDLK